MDRGRPRTGVYIDGFNFYYAAFRRGASRRTSGWTWCGSATSRCRVTMSSSCACSLRGSTQARGAGPSVHVKTVISRRWRRCRGSRCISASLPSTRRHPPSSSTRRGGPATAEVWVPEEKGSDVNLASHLLLDAFRDALRCGRRRLQRCRSSRTGQDRARRARQDGRCAQSGGRPEEVHLRGPSRFRPDGPDAGTSLRRSSHLTLTDSAWSPHLEAGRVVTGSATPALSPRAPAAMRLWRRGGGRAGRR